MNIGFVTTWLERGATYVTKTYMKLLEENHNLYVFARGGEFLDKEIYGPYKVTHGLRLRGTSLDWRQLSKWIDDNKLDCILFNEQNDFECLYKIKQNFPKVAIGTYIDYYKEDTVKDFEIYDFLICNTKRHYSVFKWHPNAYYVPWGIDLDTFKYEISNENKEELVFFHSMGMSPRKGTDLLIKAFISGEFYKKDAKLIIHTQVNIDHIISAKEAERNNISIIKKTVPHPGLYNLGDIYVYPTTLDGLGLTIYEALASGLPVITTDVAPMNEVISNCNGRLVKVDEFRCRKDAYYWPLAIASEKSLVEEIQFYIDNKDKINKYKKQAREFAEKELDILNRKKEINCIFESCNSNKKEKNIMSNKIKTSKSTRRKLILKNIVEEFCPNILTHTIRQYKEEKRRNGR